jgi:hypothetical protein
MNSLSVCQVKPINRHIAAWTLSALLAIVSMSAQADAERLLGSTRLTKAENDVDVLSFKPCRAGVDSLKLRIRKGNAEIESLWVRFNNGERQTLPVRQRISKGGESRWIDLHGRQRCVVAVGVIGDSEASRRQAKVEIYMR